MSKIIIVDSDRGRATMLASVLAALYDVFVITTCKELLQYILQQEVNLVILATSVHDTNFYFKMVIHCQPSIKSMLLVVSPLSSVTIVKLLSDYRIDAYIFDSDVSINVLERVRFSLNVPVKTTSDIYLFQHLVVLPSKRQCWTQTQHLCDRVVLTYFEFSILTLLAQQAGYPVRRLDIIQHLRGQGKATQVRTVDVLIARLRKKIGRSLIQTVVGVGYMFVDEQYTC